MKELKRNFYEWDIYSQVPADNSKFPCSKFYFNPLITANLFDSIYSVAKYSNNDNCGLFASLTYVSPDCNLLCNLEVKENFEYMC